MILLIYLFDLILFLQDYFEYTIKKHETIAGNPPVQIYVNKMKNRIAFKIKNGYKLELLTKKSNAIIRKRRKKKLIKTKMVSLCQDQRLSKLFWYTVI